MILDAHCKLGDGREIDIEVQKANNDNHQKRVRYNGSVLTANIMVPGEKFEKVPEVCVKSWKDLIQKQEKKGVKRASMI